MGKKHDPPKLNLDMFGGLGSLIQYIKGHPLVPWVVPERVPMGGECMLHWKPYSAHVDTPRAKPHRLPAMVSMLDAEPGINIQQPPPRKGVQNPCGEIDLSAAATACALDHLWPMLAINELDLSIWGEVQVEAAPLVLDGWDDDPLGD